MLKNCHLFSRLVLFPFVCGVSVWAHDDDIEVPVAAVPQPVKKVAALRGNDSLVVRPTIQDFLEDKLRCKVDDFRATYDLTKPQQEKMALACRADINRVARDTQNVLHSGAFWQSQSTLFDSDSFLSKMIPRILTGEQQAKYQNNLDERLRMRHRSNIEGVIREIERHVVLKIPQQEALVDMLLRETHPPKVEGKRDPERLKFQVSKLPEETWKPLFDEDRWPTVRRVFGGFHKFGVLFADEPPTDVSGDESAISNGKSSDEKGGD